TATGGTGGAGIGGGAVYSSDTGNGGNITISGGAVTAQGGADGNAGDGSVGGGAGIGGGGGSDGGSGGVVTLSDGYVFAAAGSEDAQDIGQGDNGSTDEGTLTISGTVAVFLKYDACVTPTTTTHTHVDVNDTTDDMYGIANTPGWESPFGAWLRLYTLSFDANGGTGTLPETHTALYGSQATVPDGSELGRTGYTFAEWNTQEDGSGTSYAADSVFTYDATTTLYAQWTKNAQQTRNTSRSDDDDDSPTVRTDSVSNVTVFGATPHGTVTSNGGAAVTERGFVYGKTPNPVIGGAGVSKLAAGTGTGSFSASLTGLKSDTIYYVRAYAINREGVSYGAAVDFRTQEYDLSDNPNTGAAGGNSGWLLFGVSAADLAALVALGKRRKAYRR
ncbi:MAG TPA: InlB B-repeat-containing protein, partial [Oscillospiraceae bacterium]|nr:InlB B-repeat-containing protein [Oscillospiraceae bacterium]